MSNKTIRLVVFLVGLFVSAQLIADVGATKFVEIGGVVMPGGTLVFAITFTLRDLIHKRMGKEWAKAAIFTAAGMNIFLAVYLAMIARLPSPTFFAYGEAWTAIFAIVPAITIGSIVAELASGLTDTAIYQRWVDRFPNAPQWSRVLVSNAISLPVDTLVFSLLAFVLLPPLTGGQALPWGVALMRVASGQMLYKAIVTVLSIPLIYAVGSKPILSDNVQ